MQRSEDVPSFFHNLVIGTLQQKVAIAWGKDAIMKAHATFHDTIFKDCKIPSDDLSIRPLGSSQAIGVWVQT